MTTIKKEKKQAAMQPLKEVFANIVKAKGVAPAVGGGASSGSGGPAAPAVGRGSGSAGPKT
eukprot:13628710-Alexandrium_andersonii.AAC.1